MRNELKQIGLSDDEINIYLCLLENKPLKVTEIARKLNLARTTVYRFTNSLQEKGLVSELLIKNIKTYSPLPPKQIPQLIQTKLDQVQEIIPQLNNILNKGKEPNTSVYIGLSGLKTVMNDILETNLEYTAFGSIETFFEDTNLFTKIWMRKATEKKIKGKLLNHKKVSTTKFEKLKILPKNQFSKITTVTYGTKTAIFIWKKPHNVILIDDKEVTQSNKKLFETMWKIAK